MVRKTGFRAIFARECKRILSSKICIWGIIVAPILCMIILLWMMNSGLPTRIPVAVVDMDNSTTSRSLIRQLDAFPRTNIKFKELSFTEARKKMEQMEVYAILHIPSDFSKDAMSGKQPQLTYYTNNAFLISGSLLFQDLKAISSLAAASVGLKTGMAKGYSAEQIIPIIQPISIEAHPQGNVWLSYSIYLNNSVLPGVLQLIMMIFTVSAFGSEVKLGNGRKLLAMGENSIIKVILGKLLPYTAIYIIIALLFMSILYYYNSFPLQSGFLPMFSNYLLLIFASQSFGIILMGLFKNYRFSLSIASLLSMISFSIAGFSFSTLAMDTPLQALSNLFPLRHFFLIYIDQALNGIPLKYSWHSYAMLASFIVVGCLFYRRLYKFLKDNKYEA